MKSSILPNQLLEALITAIYKKRKRNFGNNRLISLTSVISNIFESIVRNAIGICANAKLLYTVTCFLRSMEWYHISKWMSWYYLHRLFQNIRLRASCTITQKGGIVRNNGKFLKWIESFLLKKRQQVKVGESVSKWVSVKRGVPEASVLGLILFVLFIRDMPGTI